MATKKKESTMKTAGVKNAAVISPDAFLYWDAPFAAQVVNKYRNHILFDSGFIIRTNENVYTFSMRYLGDTSIYLNESDKIDMYYSVKKAREDCSEPESNLKATVKRDYIFL